MVVADDRAPTTLAVQFAGVSGASGSATRTRDRTQLAPFRAQKQALRLVTRKVIILRATAGLQSACLPTCWAVPPRGGALAKMTEPNWAALLYPRSAGQCR